MKQAGFYVSLVRVFCSLLIKTSITYTKRLYTTDEEHCTVPQRWRWNRGSIEEAESTTQEVEIVFKLSSRDEVSQEQRRETNKLLYSHRASPKHISDVFNAALERCGM